MKFQDLVLSDIPSKSAKIKARKTKGQTNDAAAVKSETNEADPVKA